MTEETAKLADAEIANLIAQTSKLNAETARIQAELSVRMAAEARRFSAEAKKYEAEARWHPVVTVTAIFGAAAAFVGAIIALTKLTLG